MQPPPADGALHPFSRPCPSAPPLPSPPPPLPSALCSASGSFSIPFSRPLLSFLSFPSVSSLPSPHPSPLPLLLLSPLLPLPLPLPHQSSSPLPSPCPPPLSPLFSVHSVSCESHRSHLRSLFLQQQQLRQHLPSTPTFPSLITRGFRAVSMTAAATDHRNPTHSR